MGDSRYILADAFWGASEGQYNQIANYAYTQSEINIKIGKRAPNDYVKAVEAQCDGGGKAKYGGITDEAMLEENLRANCVPGGVGEMTVDEYPDFLEERRKLMAAKIKDYYFSL